MLLILVVVAVFCTFFPSVPNLTPCCLSPLFDHELLDSWGGSGISFSSSPACQSQHDHTSHPTHTFMAALCRQSCELPPSQLADEKLCVFLFGCSSSDPAPPPAPHTHTHTCTPLLPPHSLSSVFCVTPLHRIAVQG